MKLLSIAAAAAVLAGAPLMAQAQSFKLDLPKGELQTADGQRAVKIWAGQVADQVCGRDDIPDPLGVSGERAQCRADMIAKANAAAARQAAKDRAQTQG